MRPKSLLTKEDIVTMKEYAQAYAGIDKVNTDYLINPWDKNKMTMFKLLGKKLRVTVPIKITVNQRQQEADLRTFHRVPLTGTYEKDSGHIFIRRFEEYFSNLLTQGVIPEICLDRFKKMFYNNNILRGTFKVEVEPYITYGNLDMETHNNYYMFINNNKPDKVIKITNDTKIQRAIQKLLKFYDFPYMDDYNDWKNKVSSVTTVKTKIQNVVLSIHPLDFMTASDNNCNWSSCMSWRTGGYSSGTLEMMNSNMVIIAYVENKNDKFMFNEHELTNKSWRAFFYIHKDIICSGKNYPFQNYELSQEVVKVLREMAEENLGWKYQYGVQQYYDLFPFSQNDYLRNDYNIRYMHRTYDWNRHQFNEATYNYPKNEKHSIIISTLGMYNDLVEDHSTKYFCVRNYVKHNLFLNASGPAYCLCCGQRINKNEKYDSCEEDFLTHGRQKYCEDCQNKYHCDWCGGVHNDEELYVVNFFPFKEPRIHEMYATATKMVVCKKCIESGEIMYDGTNNLYMSTAGYLYYKKYEDEIIAHYNVIKENDKDEEYSSLHFRRHAYHVPIDHSKVISAKEAISRGLYCETKNCDSLSA
jgi:hypothetical protein